MRYPPRLAHLATRAVVVARLTPLYAASHNVDEDLAAEQLDAAFNGPLLDRLLGACWGALLASSKRQDEQALLDKVAKSLADRPLRRGGGKAELNAAWSAFFLMADIDAGIAGEAARRMLETEKGQQMAESGLAEAGRYLAKALTR